MVPFPDKTQKQLFLLYILKCLLGLSICYFFYQRYPHLEVNWSMISLVIVLSPNDDEAHKFAWDRIKANIIGSMVGLTLFFIHDPNLFTMCLGVIATILICQFLTLGPATRSALAALLIVLVQEKADHSWQAGWQRMIFVLLGCFVAIALTYFFSFLRKNIFLK